MPEDRKRKAQGNSHVDTIQQQSNPEKRKKYNPPSVMSEPSAEPSIVPAITSSKQSSNSVALSSEVTPVKQSKSKSNLIRIDTPETYTPTVSPITTSRRIKQIERSYKGNISVPNVKGLIAEKIVADLVKEKGLTQVPCGKNGLDLVFAVETEEQLVAMKTLLYQSAATNQSGQRSSTRLSEKSKRSNTKQQIERYWDTVCGTHGIPAEPPFLVVIETKSDNAALTCNQKNPDSYIPNHLRKLAKKEHSGTLSFKSQADIQQVDQQNEYMKDTEDEYEEDDNLETPDYYARICAYPILPLLVRANNFQHDTVELSINFWEKPTKGSRRIATNPITAPIPDDCRHLANSTQIGSATENIIIGWLVKCNQWHYAGDVKHTGEHGIDAIFFDDAGNVYVVEIKGHYHTDNYERKPFGRHSLSLYDNQLSKAQKNPIEFVKNACKKAIAFSTTSQQSHKNALGLQQLLKENYPHVYFRQATAFLPNYGKTGTLDVTVKQWGTQEEVPYLQEQDDAILSNSNMALTPPALRLFDRQNIHTYQYRSPFNGRSTSPQTCSSGSSTSSTTCTSNHQDNTNLFYPKLINKRKAKRQLDSNGEFDQEIDDFSLSEDSDSELADSPDFGPTNCNTITDDTFDVDSPLIFSPEHELTAPDTDTESHYDPTDPKGKREVDDGTEDPLAEVFHLYDTVDSFHSANPNSFFAPYPASPQGTMSFTHVVEKDTTEDMNILP